MEVENDLARALDTVSDENMEKLDASCKKMLSIQEYPCMDIENVRERV